MSYETDRYHLQRLPGHSLAVTECGIQICHAGHATPRLKYPDYAAHFIVEGKGVFCTGGKEIALSAGQGFLILPGLDCTYTADKKHPWKYIYVSFRGVDAEALVKAAGLTEPIPVFDFALDDDMIRDIYAMHSAGKRDEALGYDVTGYFLLVMSRLIRSHATSRVPEETVQREYVRRAVQYVEDNYALHISTSDIALHIGLDRTYLYRLFVRQKGISPSQYLIDYRLKKAVQLLEESELTIAEVAAAAGFRDMAYFYRAFAQRYQKTPREYRAATRTQA